MCYNCGCKMYEEDHGHENYITISKVKKLAEESNLPLKQVEKNMYEGFKEKVEESASV